MDECVDLVLTVAIVALLVEVLLHLSPATTGRVQLEGPQELVGNLELGAHGEDLVHEVLHADDAVLAQHRLNLVVVRHSDALAVDLGVATLVDELTHGLQVGVTEKKVRVKQDKTEGRLLPVGDVRLNQLQHLLGGSVQAHKHGVVDLAQTQKLQNLAGLGVQSVDTAQKTST